MSWNFLPRPPDNTYQIDLTRALTGWWVEYQQVIKSVSVQTNGDVTLGASGSQAMTAGFVYIPSGAGAPTGTPTTRTGFVPLYLDRTNKQLYYYNGAWFKSAAFT